MGYPVMPVNQAKLNKIQQGEKARIGGKVREILSGLVLLGVIPCWVFTIQGSARRKKKVVHKSATDDKKLQVWLVTGCACF